MEITGLFLMLTIFIFMPVIYIFNNNEAFFIILAVILSVKALIDIKVFFFGKIDFTLSKELEDKEALKEELHEEMEAILGINVDKLNNAFKYAGYLSVLLFNLYCMTFANTVYLKSLIIINCVFVFLDLKIIFKNKEINDLEMSKNNKIRRFIYNITLLIIIICTFLNKYEGHSY